MVAKPTVHMNGTSRKDLFDQYIKQINAIRTAIKVVQRNGPNGRDYYVQADKDAFTNAAREHYARVNKLHEILAELNEIAEPLA